MTNRPLVPQHIRRSSERGTTLIETLVAIAVFTVVFLVALTLHQTATSSYLRTDSAVIQQQNIRFTMDRMSETLRDAGAGHNMLGSKKVADEQIEGAWESAIFVRGDFDGERETALENAAVFPMVTTGNDEIVGYVLRKPGANSRTISIQADLTGTGRDAIFTSNTTISGEETASIEVAAYTVAQQTNPPYQLTRLTFSDAGVPQYEVIADNIKRLSFVYYPATGTTAVAVGNSAANTERDERATIRKIQVSLVGVSDRQDMEYKPGYRDFTLEQTILAVNLGVVGSRHNTIPPIILPVPDSITACNGHCRHHLIRWAAADGVSIYRLEITAPAFGGVGSYTSTNDVPGLQYEFTEPDADITAGVFREFTFRVASTSGVTVGTYTTSVSRTSANDPQSVPSAPPNVAGLGAGSEHAMDVTWEAVSTNTGAITDTTRCISAGSIGGGSAPPAPWNQQPVDLTNSKVFRARSDGTNNGTAATVDVSTEQIGALQNAVANTAFRDRTAAPCSGYFYRVQACDICNVTSEFSAPMTSPVSFTVPNGTTPAKPPAAPTTVGSVGSNGTNYTVKLQWSPVTFASDGKPATVAHYVLERWRKLGTAGTYAFETSYDIYEDTVGPTDSPLETVSGETAYYRYYVRGVYDCGAPATGPLSDPYDLACSPPASNTVDITKPVFNDMFTRPSEDTIPLQLTTAGTGWTSAQVLIKDSFGNVLHSDSLIEAPVANRYTFTSWLIPASVPDGTYSVSATAMVGACRAIAANTAFTIETTACGQRIVNASFQGTGAHFATSMNFQIENTCPSNVVFDKLTLTWSGVFSTARANQLTKGSTLYTNSTGVASGNTMSLSSPVTLTSGTVLSPSFSSTFTLGFNDNFTDDATKNGSTGSFTSLVANVTSPTLTSEQLVDGVPIP